MTTIWKSCWCTKWWTAYGAIAYTQKMLVCTRVATVCSFIQSRPSTKTMFYSIAKSQISQKPRNLSVLAGYDSAVPTQTERIHGSSYNLSMHRKIFLFFPLITKVERHFCCRFKILFYFLWRLPPPKRIFEVCTPFHSFAFFPRAFHSLSPVTMTLFVIRFSFIRCWNGKNLLKICFTSVYIKKNEIAMKLLRFFQDFSMAEKINEKKNIERKNRMAPVAAVAASLSAFGMESNAIHSVCRCTQAQAAVSRCHLDIITVFHCM